MLETTSSISPIESAPANMHFVYCEHIPENTPAIINAIGDADIVALELHDGTTEERENLRHQLNTLSHADSSTEAKKSILMELTASIGPSETNLVAGLADSLQSSGKQFELIDMPEDNQENITLMQAERSAEGAFVFAVERRGPSSVKRAFDEMLSARAATVRAREKHVIKQLRDLGAENPQATIAIVQGAVHTPTYFPYKTHSTRTFVENNARSATIQFAPLEVALRAKNIFPNKDLDDTTYKRALLDQLVHLSDPKDDGTYAARVNIDQLDGEIIRFERSLMKGIGGKIGRVATKRPQP